MSRGKAEAEEGYERLASSSCRGIGRPDDGDPAQPREAPAVNSVEMNNMRVRPGRLGCRGRS